MSVDIVVGLCAGDEAKGKTIFSLVCSVKYDIVSRYNGSSNSGHTTVWKDKVYKLHMLPCGVLNENVTNILAPGVFVNSKEFLDEKKEVETVSGVKSTVYISEKCQVVLPYHIDMNKIEEARLGKSPAGSTCKGTSPAAVDFVNKSGIQMCDLFGPDDVLLEKIKRSYNIKKALANFYRDEEKTINEFYITSPEDIFDQILSYRDELRQYVVDTDSIFMDAISNGKNILFESQCGFEKDLYHGQYSEITSSSCLAAQACVSSGIPVNKIDNIIGVIKAYYTMVGKGEMPSELHGAEAHELREINGEYGATSGRPRRCGWLPIPLVKKAIEMNGCTDLSLALLDVLGHYDKIPICVAYKNKNTSEITTEHLMAKDLKNVEAIFEYLSGWQCDISNITNYEDLPPNAKNYVEFIENHIGKRIRYISVSKDQRLIDRG